MDATRLSVAALLLSLVAAVLVFVLAISSTAPRPDPARDAALLSQLDRLAADVTDLRTEIRDLASAIPAPADTSGLEQRLDVLTAQVERLHDGVWSACVRIAGLSSAAVTTAAAPAASPSPSPSPPILVPVC